MTKFKIYRVTWKVHKQNFFIFVSSFSLFCFHFHMLPSSLLHFTNKHKKEGGFGYSVYIDTIEDTLRALSLLLPGKSYNLPLFFLFLCN